MIIGLSRPTAPKYPIPDIDAAVVAKHAELLGFDSILFGEHPIRPLDEDTTNNVHSDGVPYFQDALVALSRISGMTERIRFGFGVLLPVQHNPVRLAKQLACLDFYSGGRLTVGVGTGWSRGECEAVGGRFEKRWGQTAEAVVLMRKLWTQERVEFHGEYFQVPAVHCFPQPLQRPGPPILIGSNNDSAFPRIVDFGDGWMPALVTPEQIASGPEFIARGHAHTLELAEKKGRDMKRVPTTVILRGVVDRDTIQRFADVGVDGVNIIIPYYESIEQAQAHLNQLASEVL